MSDWSNDFEIAIGAVFDDAASQRVISDFLQFAKRVEENARSSTRQQIGDAQKAATKRLTDQRAANRKWSEAEKQHARAMTLITREFLRERAQAEREAKQSERREFERQAKRQLADQRAANQRAQAQLAADLKDAQARRRSAQKIAEQDNASGLRRFEAQEKAAARNRERLAKQQAATEARLNAARLAEAARADRARITQQTLATKEQAALARREGEKLAQQQKQTDRLLFNAEQESSARRIARAKAFYSTLASVARSGAQATQNVVTSFFRRREAAARQVGDRITNIDRSTTNRSTSVIRQQLDAQNREYTTAAQRRLRIIETSAATERKVITANAVKQAEAQAAIQRRTSTGLVGAATGRSVVGGGLQGLLLGGAGVYGIKKLIDASSSLAESQSKVRVVFGDSAKAIFDFASNSAKAIGESEQATLEALGTYGNLFQSFGVGRKLAAEYSVGLVKLASDLASFNNTSVQDAIEALRSGLTGETEPLKRYGIAINETLLKQEAARLGLVKANVSQTELTRNTIAAEKAQRAAAVAASKYGAESIQAREAMAKYDAVVEKVGKSLKGKLPAQLDSAQKAQAAYSLIMQRSTLAQGDFNRTQAGFANQSRIVTARLKDLQAAAGNGLLPIALALAYTFNKAVLPALEKSVDAVSGFIKKIAEGKGVYRVVRDGLLGIAVGLGAVLAAKAGVEVIGLLASGVKLLGAAVVAAPVVSALVGLGAVGYTLYRNAPGIRSFFDSLVEGTKNWYLVGYRISEPIKNLSKIVLLQSSFGAAARVIVGGFGLMQRGVEQFRRGFGTGGLEDALRYTLAGLGDALAPAKDVVADGLQTIFERGRDFLTQRALPILGEARLNVGSFLLPLLGLTGGDGGIVSRLVTSAITKLFLGSIASFNPDLPAAQLGAKGREIIDRALAIARRSATNVQAFFGSLFGGEVDFDSFASTLGGQLNETISGAFSRLKERLGPINDLLAAIGGAVASGFTTYVLPKLIELPRIVGRFISKTVFSEEFLKAISIGAAAIAGTALVVAGQFVRGFIEGLIARRGDIAKTVLDIITFTAKAVLGTGNPFAILTGTIIAAFAGAKVLGAISTLRGQFRIAAAGMTGDAAKLQQAVADAAQAKQPASTSKVGNAALAISDGYRKAETVVRRIGGTIENAGAKTIKLGGLIDGVGNRLLKLPLDATTNAAGRLVSGTTGRFVKDTTASLNSLQRRAGEFANKYAGLLSTPLVKAGAALQSFPRTVQSKLQAASSGVKNFASALSSTVPDGVSKAQLAVQVGASTMTGYMTGLAETSQAKAIGILASVGEVAAAFAVGGPVVGGITAVATAIGLVWGNSSAAAERAQERQKVIAANLTASAEEIGAAFRAAFKDQGGATSGEGRAAGVLRIIRDLLDVNSKGAKDFADRFKTDMNDVATAASLPRKEFERFTSAVIDRNVSEVLEGNADAIKRFSNQTRIAGQAAVTSFLDSLASKEDSATFERILQSSGADIIDLQKKVQTGAISIGEFRDRMVEIGFTTQDADRAYKAYKESLTEAIGNTAGGQFLRNLPGQLYASVRQQAILNEANAELQSRLEGFGPVAERFSSAWGRIKAAIDKAKEAYLNWVDASTGRELSRAEAISGLFGAAQDFTTPEEGENSLLAEARQTRARVEAQRVIAGQLQELAKRAAGDPAKLNALINDFFNELRAGTNDKETIDFFNQIQYLTADPQSIQILVDSQPAIEGLNGLETQIRTLLQLPENSPLRVGLEKARNFDESKVLVTASLTELAKQDPRIQAYIEKNGGFDTVVASIAADAGFIDSLKAKAEADLDADPFTKKKNLITAGLAELEKRETTLRVTPKLYDPTGGWTKLFGFMGINLSINGGPSGSVPTGGNWSDYGGGSSSRTGPQQTVPPTRGERGRPRNLTSSGRRSGPGPVRPDGESGGMIGYQGARNRGKNPGIPPMNGGDAPTPWPFIPNKEGSWSNNLPWEFLRAFYDAFKPKETFWRIGQVLAFNTEKLGIDLGRNLGNAITLTGERLGGKTRSTGLDVTLGAWRSVQKAIIPTAEGPVGGPQNLVNSQGFRFEGVGRAAVKALGNEAPFRLGDDATGVAAQAADLIERVKAKILNFLRLSRAAIDRPFDIIDWDLGRVLEEVLTSAATRIRNVVWRGGDAILADARAAIEAALPSSSAPTPNGSTGGRRNLTSGGDLLIPFFATGGVTAYAAGGITQAHVQRHQRIKYAEPETGGEAYIPRLGNRLRSMAVLQQAASWFGGRFVRGGTVGMAAGGVMAGESLYAGGLMSPAEAAAERRLSAHIAEVLVLIDRIMARVSKSMTLAEARAAVLEATAAHHQLGAAEGAQWDAALTRFFAGPTVPMSAAGPSLPSPTRPGSSPTANIDFTKPQVVINRNLTVQADITSTQPVPTALEVVRRARDSDFLAGGPALEMEYVG